MCEAGAGGGHGDLNQQNELELDDLAVFAELMGLCSDKLKLQPQLLTNVKKMLMDAMEDPRKKISLDGTELGIDVSGNSQQDQDLDDLDNVALDKIVPALAKVVARTKQDAAPGKRLSVAGPASDLPKQITFPYSRHSSYTELCLLVEAFRPKNIYPCTVDQRNWNPKQSMGYLFGHIYGNGPPMFSHDQIMLQQFSDEPTAAARRGTDRNRFSQDTQDYEEGAAPKNDTKASRDPSLAVDTARRPSLDEEDADEQFRSKRRKLEAQPDIWPRQHIDHYSPSWKDNAGRRSSKAHSRGSGPDHADGPSTRSRHEETTAPLGKSRRRQETLSPTRHINEWQRRATNDHHQRSLALGGPSPAGRSAESNSGHHQAEEYGRLSPARSMTPELVDSSEEESVELDEAELRFAIQQEAYDAALGKGLDWSEIGLVSVNGHQVKEEEL